MGGFLGIGGASWKRDRQEQLLGFTQLHNVFNFALPQAEATTTAGAGDVGAASNYYRRVLSGNRTAAQQAIAPGTNAARAASDAARRQAAAAGTARGGGTAALNQERATQTQAEIDNALFQARTEAAKGATEVGKAELGAGADLTALAEKTGADLTRLSGEARAVDFKINQSIVGDITSAITDAFAAFV